MKRFFAAPFLAALILLPLVLPRIAQAAGETKEFEAHNFKMTLPTSSWQWLEVDDERKGMGYRAGWGRAVSDGRVIVWARVVPSDGLPVNELLEEVKQALSQAFSEVLGVRVQDCTLGGIAGRELIIKGKSRETHDLYMRSLVIEQGGTFHQLIITCVGGAERKLAAEIDKMRRGYRLLQGGGPEEAEPPEGAIGGDDAEDLDNSGDWPEKGPGREGRTVILPSHNLKWTLPEGSPFEWTAVIDDETTEQGLLLGLRASVDLEDVPEPKPGQRERPTQNIATVRLFVEPTPAGLTPESFVESPGVRAQIEQNFDNISYGRTKALNDIDIGNHKGSALQMVGSKDGAVVYFRIYAVDLKGKFYQWTVRFVGDRSVDDTFAKPLGELLKGVEFQNTVEWIHGPLAIQGIPPYGQTRGYGLGEEKEIVTVGIEAEKPPELYALPFNIQEVGGNFRLAWETRSDDGQQYLYFDIQSYAVPTLRQARREEEDFVKDREGLWKQYADSPETIKKGRDPWFKARWGRGKGVGYEFTGYFRDQPFMEQGFVVTYKDYVYWVRFQFGGEDAEKAFSKIVRALKKAVKFQS